MKYWVSSVKGACDFAAHARVAASIGGSLLIFVLSFFVGTQQYDSALLYALAAILGAVTAGIVVSSWWRRRLNEVNEALSIVTEFINNDNHHKRLSN